MLRVTCPSVKASNQLRQYKTNDCSCSVSTKPSLPPETVDDFLAGDDTTLPHQKKDQQLHGDAFQFQGAAIAAQFERVAIEFEFVEMVARAGHGAAGRPTFLTRAWKRRSKWRKSKCGLFSRKTISGLRSWKALSRKCRVSSLRSRRA